MMLFWFFVGVVLMFIGMAGLIHRRQIEQWLIRRYARQMMRRMERKIDREQVKKIDNFGTVPSKEV